MHRLFPSVFLAAMLLIGSAGTSHAYLDPGTGSILLQSLIAGVVGGMVVIKMYWRKVKTFFSGGRAARRPDTDEPGFEKD